MNAPLTEAARKAIETVTLDDKYALETGRAFMSGVQALVRLPLLQRARDAQAGHNTAAFISGYRGSPLGGYDQALWQARKHLENSHVVFKPGVNEELGVTAVWGSQQLEFDPASRKYDGVFGIWYAKGPGVDRSGDALKHANLAGTAPLGGVIALAGDDHVSKSSTLAHQSDHTFIACGLPIFFPANVQDILDLGVHALAMSRYSGLWAGMKTVQEVVESGVIGADRFGPRAHLAARRFRDAAGRPPHPLARRSACAGSPDDGIQVARGARLYSREPAQPQRDRRTERPLRDHRERQGLTAIRVRR